MLTTYNNGQNEGKLYKLMYGSTSQCIIRNLTFFFWVISYPVVAQKSNRHFQLETAAIKGQSPTSETNKDAAAFSSLLVKQASVLLIFYHQRCSFI